MVKVLISKFFANCNCKNIKFYKCYSITSNSFKYCMESVRKTDYENYLCSLLLPQYLKNSILVLRAFNVEIATVQDHVTEKSIGFMRFQFWEDAVDKLYNNDVPEHPICIQLSKVIQTNKISKIYLKRLISSRRKYLLSSNFNSLEEAEEYADFSQTPIFCLLLELAEIKNIDADHAASHLGKAQGLTNILRSVSYNSAKNLVSLPQDLLLKYGVSQEDVLRCKVDKKMTNVFYEIASKAHQHLEIVKQLQKKTNRICKKIYLPIIPVDNYLKKLQLIDFNVFHPKLKQSNHLLWFKLAWENIKII